MQIMIRVVGLIALSLGIVSSAWACSCAPEFRKFEKSYAMAKAIYVAEWTTVKLSSEIAPIGSGDYLEDVQFVVAEVFKGKRRAGDVVRVRSTVGMGVCGASVRNNPIWLEALPKPGYVGPPIAASLSKSWLIYEYADEPFELEYCSRSRPMNQGGDEDVALLRSHGSQVPKPKRPPRAVVSAGPNQSLEPTRVGKPPLAAQLQR